MLWKKVRTLRTYSAISAFVHFRVGRRNEIPAAPGQLGYRPQGLKLAGRTNLKSMQAKVDKLFDELKDLVTRGWNSGKVWTFVECIQDNKNSALR